MFFAYDQFNESLQNKSINFFKINKLKWKHKNLTDPKVFKNIV